MTQGYGWIALIAAAYVPMVLLVALVLAWGLAAEVDQPFLAVPRVRLQFSHCLQSRKGYYRSSKH